MARAAGPVHLLVTDVIMPGMNGRELADRVAARSPSTRVLFVSGHIDSVLSDHGVEDHRVEVQSKPFAAATLASRVCAVLERQRERGAMARGAARPLGQRGLSA